MRSSWLEIGKNPPLWYTSVLKSTDSPTKIDMLEEKYSSTWRGFMLVSEPRSVSRSPIDKERHGSLSSRILEPCFQDPATPTTRKRLIHCPSQSITEYPSCKKKFEISGKTLLKNSHSPLNTLVTEKINEKYIRESITPDKVPRTVQKKRFDKGNVDRKGNLLADPEPPRKKEKVKSDFVSHISGLPGTVKVEIPLPKTGDIEKYRARLMLRTKPKAEKPGKQFIEGTGKWKSSIDIIKQVVKKN